MVRINTLHRASPRRRTSGRCCRGFNRLAPSSATLLDTPVSTA